MMQASYTVLALIVTVLYAQPRTAASRLSILDGGASVAKDAPWFCRGSPCPPFEVISKTQTYELREYSETTWISTVVESSNYEVAVTKGFVPLYSYLKGNNEAKLHIDMAKPAITQIHPDKDYSSTGTNYTVLFYLPGLSEATAPKPSNEEVKVVSSSKQRFYVLGFGGFATGGSILNEALKLALALETDKKSFERDEIWSALYDAPTRLWGRHNEVFFGTTDKSISAF